MKHLNIFLAILLVFSFISPAFGNLSDWYMVQEAYAIADGREWLIADMEGYGLILFVGKSSDIDINHIYFYNSRANPPNWYGYIMYGRTGSSGGFLSIDFHYYAWNGSEWKSTYIPQQHQRFTSYNHEVIYSNVDILYWPETDQVFFSRMLPPRPLDLGEIMEESPVLPTMMTVGGVVFGRALMIFGILLVILLVGYWVRSLVRLRV